MPFGVIGNGLCWNLCELEKAFLLKYRVRILERTGLRPRDYCLWKNDQTKSLQCRFMAGLPLVLGNIAGFLREPRHLLNPKRKLSIKLLKSSIIWIADFKEFSEMQLFPCFKLSDDSWVEKFGAKRFYYFLISPSPANDPQVKDYYFGFSLWKPTLRPSSEKLIEIVPSANPKHARSFFPPHFFVAFIFRLLNQRLSFWGGWKIFDSEGGAGKQG